MIQAYSGLAVAELRVCEQFIRQITSYGLFRQHLKTHLFMA